MKAFTIHPNGAHRRVDIENTLEAKQAAVGGDIQYVDLPAFATASVVAGACSLICNENGKVSGTTMSIVHGLAPNRVATKLCHAFEAGVMPGDVIVGPVLIVGPVDAEGDDTELSDEQIRTLNTVASFIFESLRDQLASRPSVN